MNIYDVTILFVTYLGGDMEYLILSQKSKAKILKYLPTNKDIEKLALYFQNFCDATRLKIMSALAMCDMCVSDLSNVLQINQTTISHQLKFLKTQGIVSSVREGKIIVYSLNEKKVNDIMYLAVSNS